MPIFRFILAFAEMLLSPAILLYLVARPIAIAADCRAVKPEAILPA